MEAAELRPDIQVSGLVMHRVNSFGLLEPTCLTRFTGFNTHIYRSAVFTE